MYPFCHFIFLTESTVSIKVLKKQFAEIKKQKLDLDSGYL